MPTQTFNFPFHKVRTEYPQSSQPVQLGGGYVFASKPKGPPQRKFILSFAAMKLYVNATTGVVDLVPNITYNLGVLEKFYTDHELYKMFIYPHPLYANLNVRFATPFSMPHMKEGGMGASEPFELQLIEDVS